MAMVCIYCKYGLPDPHPGTTGGKIQHYYVTEGDQVADKPTGNC